ncbi:MAG: TRAM domain-containing protein [Nanoarchaeota archaeon]|nr:TRAM domain-containing protein [Nanoarchaeota archaeon]
MRRSFRPPVEVGDEVDVTIEAVGAKGDGVAKVEGFVLFIPNVKEGERCKVRVTKVLKKVGFGEKIGEAAPAEPGVKEAVTEEVAALESGPVPEPEDTEDFGEEPAPAEEPAEEAPVEEAPAEEAPAEEEPAEEAPEE